MNAASLLPDPADNASVHLALEVRRLLAARNERLVLAESCTAGRVAACLAVVPGISQWLCGSLVVYRSATKTAWLSVPRQILDDPQQGPVSPIATRLLAEAALRQTPEADWAVAVTGDVGPGAPPATDGKVFVASRYRPAGLEAEWAGHQRQLQLAAPAPHDTADLPRRLRRLDEATQLVLQFLVEQLSTS